MGLEYPITLIFTEKKNVVNNPLLGIMCMTLCVFLGVTESDYLHSTTLGSFSRAIDYTQGFKDIARCILVYDLV